MLLALLLATAASLAGERAIIVLDASGSMWGQIGSKPKLEIARETLRTVLKSIPADMELGLIAYGHREKGSCEDIELVVPPATGTAATIIDAAEKMRFLGKTPLTAAVRQAAESLRFTEEKSTVILITDGLETCNADPCALATELEQGGVDFTAHVVGFGLSEEEGRQVACLAENTGGKYLPAADAGQLTDALEQVVQAEPAPAPQPAPEPAPDFNFAPSATMSEGGPELGRDDNLVWEVYAANADGSRGENVVTDYYGGWKGRLEPGDYIVNARLDHAAVEQKVTIEPDKVATPHFVLDAGRLVIRARASEGAAIADNAAINVRYPSDGDTTYYGEMKAVFPAGEQVLTIKLGDGAVTETIALKAGQTIEKDVIVGVGRAVVNALYAAGGDRVDSGNMFTRIFKAKKKIDGTREELSYAYGPDAAFDLPAGDYVALVAMDQAAVEQPFSIKVGERQDVTAVLDAGVLAISAPGAKYIEVSGAAKDIQGNRKQFGYAFAETHQTTLPAGDYAVSAERGDPAVKTEAPATVKAGERTEITVP
ncbi:MAG: VWA domain-containing protein [Rhizobiaceae bacterium]|nr:VWA domain-containing protein [Rhizobiaceae bacterium]